MMWWLLLSSLWTASVVCVAQAAASQSATKKPHLVFVLADDYGFHDIGYHGSEFSTPTLDAMASEGVKLENYYVQPICTPSRSQLISGRYQIHTGLQHRTIGHSQPNALPLGHPTLPDKLKEAGYATHMVGKWHLGFYKEQFLPINRGFDTFYGFYLGHGDHYTHKTKYLDKVLYLDLHDQDKPVWNETGHYSTHLFTEKAVERITNHDSSKPMFLYLAYQAVHDPLEAPQEYIDKFSHISDVKRRTYAAMVAVMDEGVANVTQALKARGMWKDTVFIFSSDNGGYPKSGANNFPLRGYKRSLFEGGIHAIGFVNAANMTQAGKVNRELIHISDWYPTLVGLAGGSITDADQLDGFDQWKTISQGHRSPRTELLHNIDPKQRRRGDLLYHNTFDHRIQAALRWGDWKLVTGSPGPADWTPPPLEPPGYVRPVNTDKSTKNLWLFNIAQDPTERNDLSSSSHHASIVRTMLHKLQAYFNSSVPVVYPAFDRNSSPARLGGVYGPWM